MRLAGKDRAFDDDVSRIHHREAFRKFRRIVDHASRDVALYVRVLLITCGCHEDSQMERAGLGLDGECRFIGEHLAVVPRR